MTNLQVRLQFVAKEFISKNSLWRESLIYEWTPTSHGVKLMMGMCVMGHAFMVRAEFDRYMACSTIHETCKLMMKAMTRMLGKEFKIEIIDCEEDCRGV